jgi:hypothetical protein
MYYSLHFNALPKKMWHLHEALGMQDGAVVWRGICAVEWQAKLAKVFIETIFT